MSKDKDEEQRRSIRNANMIGAGQKMNIERDENGKQHNFTKAADQRPDRRNFKPSGKNWADHSKDTSPKK